MRGIFYYQDKKLTKYRLHDNNITKKGFSDDICTVLALIEAEYPEMIRYINVRRTMNYLHKLKEKNFNYIIPVLSMGFINILLAAITKYRLSKKIAKQNV
jgi:hypothetical protein